MPADRYGIDVGQIIGARNAFADQQQRQQINALALQKGQMDLDQAPAMNALALKKANLDVSGAEQAQQFAKHVYQTQQTVDALGALDAVPDDVLPQATSAVLAKLKTDGIEGVDQLGQALASAGNDPVKLRAAVKQQAQAGMSYAAQLAQKNADRTFGAQQENTKAVRESTDAYRAATLAQGDERNRQGQERIDAAKAAAIAPTQDLTPDPDSGSILAAAGISLPAFSVLTGKASTLPRDKASRDAAFKQAQEFANKRGVDVSTLTSQYKAYNETLESNIKRVNQTKIMEGELAGTLDNLKPVSDAAGLGALRIANVAKIWAGQETNDPIVEQYAFQLNQLRSELAAYNGALQGRSGASLTQQDYAEAERVIKGGLSTKAADGLRTAVASATEKMGAVLNKNVDTARKSVWDLFGVGSNYKSKGVAPTDQADAAPGKVIDFKDLHPGQPSGAPQVPGAR